jgi:hypothetical protein
MQIQITVRELPSPVKTACRVISALDIDPGRITSHTEVVDHPGVDRFGQHWRVTKDLPAFPEPSSGQRAFCSIPTVFFGQ